MSRTLLIGLSIAGIAVVAYLIHQVGAADLVANARRTGWMIVPIVAVHGVVYLGAAYAWYLVMAGEPGRPAFWRTYTTTISGFALNLVTPMVNVGGEPFKIAAVAPTLGVERATSSVVTFTMLYALSHLLVWVATVILALAVLPQDAASIMTLVIVGSVCALLIALVFAGHRYGVIEFGLNLLRLLPIPGRFTARLEAARPLVVRLDRAITDFYHRRPARFASALAVCCACRLVAPLEYHLIFSSVDLNVGYGTSFLLANFAALILNALFFMPFELGAKEGGMYVLFELFALDPELGVYATMASRVRELVWVVVGLGLMWVARK